MFPFGIIVVKSGKVGLRGGMSAQGRPASDRLFLASLIAENNSFSPIPTGYGAFEAEGLRRNGDRSVDPFGMGPALDAAGDAARAQGWVLVEGLCAAASPLGLVAQEAWEALRDEILADLRAAMPVGAVVLVLHGAMMAQDCEDCEGELIAQVRAIVGPETPIGVELDLHCHFTERMRSCADVIVAYKEYPHIDIAERAVEVVRLVTAAARGEIAPRIGVFDCRMTAGVWATLVPPLQGFVARMRATEGRDGVLSVSLGHGFEYGDATEGGTKVWVVTDGDEGQAFALAERLGRELWDLRHALDARMPGVGAALDRVEAASSHPVVLTDPADNPGGGALGDSTFILEQLVSRRMGGVALGGMWDPGAVQLCREAGVGARFSLRVGGKGGRFSGAPLDLEVQVRAYRADHVQTALGGVTPLGPSAWVTTREGIDLVLISLRQQVLGTDLFTGLGVTLHDKRAIVVKSMQHFYEAFRDLAAEVIAVDTPGLLTADIASLPTVRRSRRVWPIVADPFVGPA